MLPVPIPPSRCCLRLFPHSQIRVPNVAPPPGRKRSLNPCCPNCTEDVVRASPKTFDEACNRWRDLYRNALADQDEQNRVVLDISATPKMRKAAEGRRRQAENQLRLLRNEDAETGYSDFYSYRYFASEG